MKKIVPLFFLFIFLFNTGGFYFAFIAQQYSIKKEIVAEIEAGVFTTDLTIVAISKSEFSTIRWLEDDEMVYEGEMFDVVKKTETKDSVIFHCINDKKEKSLFSKLDEHINIHLLAHSPSKTQKKTGTFSVKLFFAAHSNKELFSIPFSKVNFQFVNSMLNPPCIEKIAPPPRFV